MAGQSSFIKARTILFRLFPVRALTHLWQNRPRMVKAWNVYGDKSAVPDGHPSAYGDDDLHNSPPGYAFRPGVKWAILVIMFVVQISMNFNASVFPNATGGIVHEFGVSRAAVLIGQTVFLFTYGLGCELWAPWSEEFGRKPVLQLSLLLVNLWQLMGMFAKNLPTIITGRALGGLSSGGGSVTLGIVADMWPAHSHQAALNFVVLGSVLGGVVGPIAGGFLEKYAPWRWNFAAQLFLGLAVQLVHLLTPETEREELLLQSGAGSGPGGPARGGRLAGTVSPAVSAGSAEKSTGTLIARQSVGSAEAAITPPATALALPPPPALPALPGPPAPQQFPTIIPPRAREPLPRRKTHRLSGHDILAIWFRPFKMFVTEPIVFCLSLLSGFSDALIFTFLESFRPVFSQWGYDAPEVGLSFIPIAVGYVIAFASFFYPIYRFRQQRRAAEARAGATPADIADAVPPESRLWWLLFTAPLLPIGLFGFAWACGGPDLVAVPYPAHAFACLVGIANFCIYMATIDYMVAAYGRYAASATGGNGMARDFLAGISALYAGPLFSRVGGAGASPAARLRNGTLILAGLATAFVVPVYVFYFYGKSIRARSAFATEIEDEQLIADVRAGLRPADDLKRLRRLPVPADLAGQEEDGGELTKM